MLPILKPLQPGKLSEIHGHFSKFLISDAMKYKDISMKLHFFATESWRTNKQYGIYTDISSFQSIVCTQETCQ